MRSHWTKAAVLCCGVTTSARKYSAPSLWRSAVRTRTPPDKRYDPTSWWSRPLWWNAVIQDIMWGKGLSNCPDPLHLHTVCACVHVRLPRLSGKVSTSRLLKSHCAFPLCRCFCMRQARPPMTFSQHEVLWACYFKAGSWCLVNTKQ